MGKDRGLGSGPYLGSWGVRNPVGLDQKLLAHRQNGQTVSFPFVLFRVVSDFSKEPALEGAFSNAMQMAGACCLRFHFVIHYL